MRVKGGKFFARWRDERRIDHRKGFHTSKEARNYQEKMRDEVRARKLHRVGTVRQLAEAWMESHSHGKTVKQKVWFERTVSQGLIRLVGDQPVAEVDPMVPNYLIEDWKKKYSVACVSNLRFRLKNLLGFLELHGALGLVKNLQRTPHAQARQVLIEPGELEKMKAASPPWFRCFLLFCFDGGLRSGEAIRVSPANYSPELGKITITVKKRRVQSFEVTEELKTILASAPMAADPTIPFLTLLRGDCDKRGGKVTESTTQFWFDRVKELTGVNPALTSHDLRRTAATELYLKYHDIGVCQRFLGHANPITTLHYIVHADNLLLKPLVEQMKVAFTRRTPAGSIAKLEANS